VDVHYLPIDQPATPEYILAVFRDMHRQQCQHDPEANSGAVLSFNTNGKQEKRDRSDCSIWSSG
jgi:hypothetical protein